MLFSKSTSEPLLHRLKSAFNSRSDLIGIVSATICLIHCIAVPLFFAYYVHDQASTVRAFGPQVELQHAHYHLGSIGFFKVDYIFLIIGLIAIIFSSKHTANKWIRIGLWVSYFALAGSVLMEETSYFFQVTLYIASVALIGAHVVNLRHLRLHLRGEAHSH
jgi:hypothetical protein